MSFGPCLCGDTHCPSCGPAQGNWRCPLCGAWADDGCEHFDPETGKPVEAFAEQFQQAAKAECEADDAFAEALREDARLAEEWENRKE